MERYRGIPELWRRLRRPAMRVLVGCGLLVPAAVMMASERTEPVTVTGVLDGETAGGNGPGGAGGSLRYVTRAASQFVPAWTEEELAPSAEAREAAPDWSGGLEALAKPVEPRLSVATLAQEFRISEALAAKIHTAAVAENIKPRIAFGLVKAESSFRTKAVSPVGAVGLTQLLPSTARWLVPGTTRRDLMVPEKNLRVGFKYLRHLLDEFDGNEKLALTAYNRGPGTVASLLRRGRDPDNGYAEKVLTGNSTRHVRLMNAKFGTKRGRG